VLTEPTMEKLKAFRLYAMAEAWTGQQRDPKCAALDFDERLGLLVDAEWLARENRRMKRSLAEARLRLTQACIEDIDSGARRGLDRSVVHQLATCRWVAEHHAVVVTGATGTGKTYVACALAQHACRKGFRATYRRATRLYDELRLAHADGTYGRVLARLAKIDVLVIDDFALTPLNERERHDLLEVLEDRVGNRATVITSQVPTKHWHPLIGDPAIADAILDRVVHVAHRIDLKGPSRRKEPSEQEPG